MSNELQSLHEQTYLTFSQFCKLACISRKTGRVLMREGVICPIKIGKRTFINSDQLAKFSKSS